MSDSPAKQAEQLRHELERHNRLYYVLDEPEVGDDVYDELLDELLLDVLVALLAW